MLTKADLKEIKELFSEQFSKNFTESRKTLREEFSGQFAQVRKSLREEFAVQFTQVRKTLREEFSGQFAEVAKSLRDDLITFKDSILSEIKKLREDVAVITGYKDQIENHETRIEKLEEIIQP